MENNNQTREPWFGVSARIFRIWLGAKKFWKWTEIVLLLVGAVLLACYGAARIESYLSSRGAIKAFESLDDAKAPKDLKPSAGKLDVAEPDFTGWGAGRIGAYKESVSKRTGTPLAVVEIPKIHLAAPLMDGTDSLTLNHALGRIAGTAQPGETGKVGIAGHRDGFFRGLKDIQAGDIVVLRTVDGRDLYTVDRIQIVTPSDVSVLRPESKPAITLVTCYPFYFIGKAPQRFVVTGYLTQHIPAGQTTTHAQAD